MTITIRQTVKLGAGIKIPTGKHTLAGKGVNYHTCFTIMAQGQIVGKPRFSARVSFTL